MPTTIRSSAIYTGSSGDASGAAPSGTTTGDLVVALLHVNGIDGTADNNGSTPFTKDLDDFEENIAGLTLAVYGRRIEAGDPSTYNFTNTGNSRWTLIVITFQDPHPDARFDVIPGGNAVAYVSEATFDAPSIDTNFADAIHVAVGCVDGGGNSLSGTPSGYAVIENGGNQAMAAVYKVIASPGATGDQTFTPTSANGEIGASFAVRDSGVGGAEGSLVRRTWMSF
jgi:hypothetical protein